MANVVKEQVYSRVGIYKVHKEAFVMVTETETVTEG